MSVLVINKFDQVLIINKIVIPGTTFLFVTIWEILHCSGANNSVLTNNTLPKFEESKIMSVLYARLRPG